VRVFVCLLALLVLSGTAGARQRVGVVVTGDYLTKPTRQAAERWLRDNGQQVVSNPLPKDAIRILLDCFVLDDARCASSVVDKRSVSDTLVSIRVDLTSRKDRAVRITIDWFVKKRSAVSARRVCEQCTEAALRSLIGAMLGDLAKSSPGIMGRIKVTSDPPGITVLLDNAAIGVTPVERDVSAGTHTIALVRDGRTGDPREVTIEAGKLVELELEPPPPAVLVTPPPAAREDRDAPPPRKAERRSRVFPAVLLGLGVAAIGGGAAMYWYGGPTGTDEEYLDLRTPGYGVAAGGGVLLLTGLVLMLRGGGDDSAPAITALPRGAAIGWAGRF
jgi:hypothetical protein